MTLADAVRFFGWSRIGVISCDDLYCRGLANGVRDVSRSFRSSGQRSYLAQSTTSFGCAAPAPLDFLALLDSFFLERFLAGALVFGPFLAIRRRHTLFDLLAGYAGTAARRKRQILKLAACKTLASSFCATSKIALNQRDAAGNEANNRR